MKVKIDVTQLDIFYGSKGNPCLCPVSRAIRKKLKIFTKVYSSPGSCDIFDSCNESVIVNFPKKVSSFIIKFDSKPKNKSKPFSFVLDIPEKLLKKKFGGI